MRLIRAQSLCGLWANGLSGSRGSAAACGAGNIIAGRASPLRRRMIEDMAIRKFAPKTQHDYVQRVKDFAAFLGRSPPTTAASQRRSRTHVGEFGARPLLSDIGCCS